MKKEERKILKKIAEVTEKKDLRKEAVRLMADYISLAVSGQSTLFVTAEILIKLELLMAVYDTKSLVDAHIVNILDREKSDKFEKVTNDPDKDRGNATYA